MKYTLALLLVLLTIPISKGATIASNGSVSDVAAKLNAAAAGDIVTIPAGTFTWTTQMTASPAPNVTLQGAGSGSTTINDQVNISTNTKLAEFNIPVTGTFRVTGIQWNLGDYGGITHTFAKDGGVLNFASVGNTSSLRFDNCIINARGVNAAAYKSVRLGEGVFGLMDHCTWNINGIGSGGAIYAYNGRGEPSDVFPAEPDGQGNYEWTQPTAFGDPTYYFYVEDCQINGAQSGDGSRIFDGFTASKMVVRFNTFFNASYGETHATGHGPDDRGMRSREIYGNSTTAGSPGGNGPNFTGIDFQNGTSLIWGNDFGPGCYKSLYFMRVVRSNNDTYGQQPTPTGWGYAGTAFNGTGSNWDGGTKNATSTVDGYPCLDQVGRGPGDLLVRYLPNKFNNAVGGISWPRQALEPVYIWKNTGSFATGWGGSVEINNAGGTRIVANRDYYFQVSGQQTSPTSPFNGTSGVGWGTLANRPTTCTTGVAYWATDQGSWNTSTSNPKGVQQNGADGVLYKATATNTWTQYYTPATYPHPLQGAAPPPDTTPPTVTAASINAAGTQLTLTASETVSIGTGGNGGLTISASGGAVTLTYASGSGSSALVYNTSRTIAPGEFITRAYVQPGNGIEDTSGNDMASFSGQSVTNNASGDVTPPTPNPMSFSSPPSAISSFSVTMTASLATDATSPPVQYYFDETSGNPGGADSGWQSSRTYTNNGLSPGIQYTYRVLARDNVTVPNQTTPSSSVNVTTPIIKGARLITPSKTIGAAFIKY